LSITPVNGAVNVSNNSTVVITFSEVVDPTSVNNILVRDGSNNYYRLAGTWAVDPVNGAKVTFTPTQPYPANATIQVWTQNLVRDLAGNTDNAYVVGTFTISSTAVDTTPPHVTSVTPVNGSTNVGRSQTVVLTFSKSINPSTVSPYSIELLAGDAPISVYPQLSADNRTVTFITTLPPASTISVAATAALADFSGNSLVPFLSQFTTAADIPPTGPAVVTQRPGSGATDVLANTLITLFTNGSPLNPSSVTGALHISQNGVLVAGTTNVNSAGRAIVFTPTSPLLLGAAVQIVLDQTATDINATPLYTVYSGSFTVMGNPATIAPQQVASNPQYSDTNVASNVIPQVEFDQALLASTVNSTNVYLYNTTNGVHVPGTASLGGANNNVVKFQPSAALTSNTTYYLYLVNVTNAQGVAAGSTIYVVFTTGTTGDTTTPTVTSVGPPNNATNVGVNAQIVVTFGKAIDPVSINATTIQVTGASQTVVPTSISFGRYFVASPDFDYVAITPQAPLPASTLMTITINGVTDAEGNAVSVQTTHFTTSAGPDLTAPTVVLASYQSGDTIATNTVFSYEFDKPMDPGTINTQTLYIYDTAVGYKPGLGTVTLSADLKTETLTLSSGTLIAGHQVLAYSNGAQDLSGNAQNSFNSGYATVGSTTDTTAPVVLETSPPANLTGVPVNSPIQIEFSKEIAQDSVGNVQLLQGGSTPVATTPSFSRLGTVLTLTPNLPLKPNTTYTVSIAGVQDTVGNVFSGTQTQGFTTGPDAKLTQPVNVSVSPCCGQTGVSDTIAINLVFDTAMDPLGFDSVLGNAVLELSSTSAVIPTTVSFSLDYKTIILTPSSPLAHSTSYTVVLKYGSVTDIAGNVYNNSISQSFTAQ
jgi:hypothetical protein